MVEYHLNEEGGLEMNYEWSANQRTIANITNHNFWNLNGEGSGTINNHWLQVNAGRYTPVDSTLIPTGIASVAGTPFDFRERQMIGARLDSSNVQLRYGGGFDHNFVLDKGITESSQWQATITGDQTGLEMQIYSTEPGLQFYGGNFMQSRHTLKSGAKDDFRTAFCLETQHFPDSPNQPGFPSTLVEPGKTYHSHTEYRIGLPK